MQSTRNQPAKHVIAWYLTMQGKAGHVRIASTGGHGPMHGFNDVSTDRKFTQGLFEPGLQCPAARLNLFGEAKALEFGHPTDHQAPQFRVALLHAGPQIGDPRPLIGQIAQRPVEVGPAFRLDLPSQRGLNLLFAARSKLKGHALLGPRSEPAADVIAADDEVLAVIRASADQNMNVGIVRIPVIDGNPVQPGAEIALGIRHQLTGKGAQIGHLGRVLRRYDEAEMMAVVLASLGEDALIDRLGSRVEHTGIRAIPGNAVSL
jgi:hypothetical protein